MGEKKHNRTLEKIVAKLDHLVHVVQTAIGMSRAEILMVRARHRHTCVPRHLITTAHVITHLHLILSARLLVEVLHLAVVRRIVILTVIVRRRIVTVCVPIEGVVRIVLVGERRIRRRLRRRRRRHQAARVATGRR